ARAIQIVEKLYEEGVEHPKMRALAETVSKLLANNSKLKIIVFSHYRDNIERIKKVLKRVEGCRPAILIGQAGSKGMSQKEQINVIRDYNVDVYNCLIGSPVSEEGLHVPSADVAIFYEPVPSEIRMIQRRGRVGRTKVGKIIFLLTKGTRDEAYYFIARRKEATMKEILKHMQEENTLEKFL
ncbi:MAG: helicase-related protein, partial [Candidatus Aenigmatarchaeota archaeon]